MQLLTTPTWLLHASCKTLKCNAHTWSLGLNHKNQCHVMLLKGKMKSLEKWWYKSIQTHMVPPHLSWHPGAKKRLCWICLCGRLTEILQKVSENRIYFFLLNWNVHDNYVPVSHLWQPLRSHCCHELLLRARSFSQICHICLDAFPQHSFYSSSLLSCVRLSFFKCLWDTMAGSEMGTVILSAAFLF